MIELPSALEAFLARRVGEADARALGASAQELSRRYRAHEPPRLATAEDVLAYAAWILPATHAQATGALRAIPLRAGSFSPRSVFDLGGGPGTAAWAALEIWPGIESVTVVDRERAVLEIGARAAVGAPWPALRDARFVEGDLPGAVPQERADLVILAHVLGELPAARAAALVRRAWEATAGVLVLIEPGTPAGFETVEAGRQLATSLGARVLAPCPHDAACPLAQGQGGRVADEDWCHFSERHARPAFQRRVKEASLPYEDAKFSHASVARFASAATPWARVLRHPWHGKGRVDLRLCTAAGLVDRTVGRSAGAAWKRARKLEWGSAVESEADLSGGRE